jgi:hypothetical protein
MTVMKRYASAVFDRANLTLVDLQNLTTPVPVVYEPSDLFAIYKSIFSLNLNSTTWDTSTQYSFLLTITTFLQGTDSETQIPSLGSIRQIRLQEFLATPIIVYNDAWLGRNVSDPDMGKSLVLAISSYRVFALRSPI